MKPASVKSVRCAIYTRVSTDHGLDQEFNSLDAQYDAGSAYIRSQAHAGWGLIHNDPNDLQKALEAFGSTNAQENPCAEEKPYSFA